MKIVWKKVLFEVFVFTVGGYTLIRLFSSQTIALVASGLILLLCLMVVIRNLKRGHIENRYEEE